MANLLQAPFTTFSARHGQCGFLVFDLLLGSDNGSNIRRFCDNTTNLRRRCLQFDRTQVSRVAVPLAGSASSVVSETTVRDSRGLAIERARSMGLFHDQSQHCHWLDPVTKIMGGSEGKPCLDRDRFCTRQIKKQNLEHGKEVHISNGPSMSLLRVIALLLA